ncbi:unnamed protein product [Pedinophyceae sp. YPF-701]|nr:unnamed protein product [Pedinophyceae sp. YPF-701]
MLLRSTGAAGTWRSTYRASPAAAVHTRWLSSPPPGAHHKGGRGGYIQCVGRPGLARCSTCKWRIQAEPDAKELQPEAQGAPLSASAAAILAAAQAPSTSAGPSLRDPALAKQDVRDPLTAFDWAGEDRALLAGSEPGRAPLRVAVLLSGGVDSSAALTLARAAGHHVEAFYLKIWFQEDFRNFWDACPWEEDLEYCSAVCDAAGVPLHVVPLSNEYWDRVVEHSIQEVASGRTPNPDVLCNSRVKFGAFFEYLEQHHGQDFDRVASGHYAALQRPEGSAAGPVRLAMTPDDVKDQTYFLAGLTQAQLARCMFPLGPLTKTQVREIAARGGLPNQDRKDSQGICFLGKVRFSEFVKEHLGEWPGPLVDDDTGDVVGYHEGFWFYTIGQRKGIRLPGGPWYVTRKDPDRNAVWVSRHYYEGGGGSRDSTLVGSLKWNTPGRPDFTKRTEVKVRHGPAKYECEVEELDGGRTLALRLPKDDQGLAAGQYAVFYQGGVCLGGGIMMGHAPDEDEADSDEDSDEGVMGSGDVEAQALPA